MKNLMLFFVVVTLIFLTSCTKEEIFDTPVQTDDTIITQAIPKAMIAAPTTTLFETSAESRTGDSNPIAVTKTSSSTVGGNLNVDFSSTHNFTDADLEATQNLDFTDAVGNNVTLSFQVNSYVGSDGYLSVSYAIGGNNLGGLVLENAQIVVEDVIMN